MNKVTTVKIVRKENCHRVLIDRKSTQLLIEKDPELKEWILFHSDKPDIVIIASNTKSHIVDILTKIVQAI